MTFCDHLDALRAVVLRCLLLTLVLGAVAFCFRQEIFSAVLAPQHADFITYRLFRLTGSTIEDFQVQLINTALLRAGMLDDPSKLAENSQALLSKLLCK